MFLSLWPNTLNAQWPNKQTLFLGLLPFHKIEVGRNLQLTAHKNTQARSEDAYLNVR